MNAIELIGEFWDVKPSDRKRGKKIMDAWHERCRKKRLEARIAERKRQNALKRIRLEQNLLLAKAEGHTTKQTQRNGK